MIQCGAFVPDRELFDGWADLYTPDESNIPAGRQRPKSDHPHSLPVDFCRHPTCGEPSA
jgi:hypothetical protein